MDNYIFYWIVNNGTFIIHISSLQICVENISYRLTNLRLQNQFMRMNWTIHKNSGIKNRESFTKYCRGSNFMVKCIAYDAPRRCEQQILLSRQGSLRDPQYHSYWSAEGIHRIDIWFEICFDKAYNYILCQSTFQNILSTYVAPASHIECRYACISCGLQAPSLKADSWKIWSAFCIVSFVDESKFASPAEMRIAENRF